MGMASKQNLNDRGIAAQEDLHFDIAISSRRRRIAIRIAIENQVEQLCSSSGRCGIVLALPFGPAAVDIRCLFCRCRIILSEDRSQTPNDITWDSSWNIVGFLSTTASEGTTNDRVTANCLLVRGSWGEGRIQNHFPDRSSLYAPHFANVVETTATLRNDCNAHF